MMPVVMILSPSITIIKQNISIIYVIFSVTEGSEMNILAKCSLFCTTFMIITNAKIIVITNPKEIFFLQILI